MYFMADDGGYSAITAAAISAAGSAAAANIAHKKNLIYSKRYYDYTQKKDIARQNYLLQNSPLIEKTALQNAGLSPNSMQQNASNDVSVPQGSAMPFGADYSSMVGNGINAAMIQSQIELNKANAKKAEADANYITIDAETLASRNEIYAELQKAETDGKKISVKLGNQTLEFNERMQPLQLDNLSASIEVAKKNAAYLEQLSSLSKEQTENMHKENEVFYKRFDNEQNKLYAEVKNLIADAGYKGELANEVSTLVGEKLNALVSQNVSSNAHSRLANAQETLLNLNAELTRRYGTYKESSQIIGNVIGSVTGLVGLGAGLKYLTGNPTSLGNPATSSVKVGGFHQ